MTSRIRYLRPDFFVDEDIARLPPLVRLFYQGLWCHADREGRLEDRPERLRVELMPYEQGFDAETALATLAAPKRPGGPGFILRYQVEGRQFIQILTWSRHQRPHVKERASEIPAPPRENTPGTGQAPSQHCAGTGQAPGQPHAKTPLNCDGDGDGDCDGNGDRERGRGEPTTPENAPPAHSQGSDRAAQSSARPSLSISESTVQELLKVKSREEVIRMLKEGNHPIPEFLLAAGRG
jgi:hypothetical protein